MEHRALQEGSQKTIVRPMSFYGIQERALYCRDNFWDARQRLIEVQNANFFWLLCEPEFIFNLSIVEDILWIAFTVFDEASMLVDRLTNQVVSFMMVEHQNLQVLDVDTSSQCKFFDVWKMIWLRWLSLLCLCRGLSLVKLEDINLPLFGISCFWIQEHVVLDISQTRLAGFY